ncbi:MAG: tetratricopeptide repeat protein [Acidobacteriota bacterium]|nr:tetratricopeptide repeat protein [Acidobacteriota bacterium]
MFIAIKQIYLFGDFRLDATNRLLLRQTETVPIPPKVFDLLLVLVERSGGVVEKEELMRSLWPDTIVEENNLTVSMSALRKALGDGKDGQKFIETIPRRGYRFVAPIEKEHPPQLKSADQTANAAASFAMPSPTESVTLSDTQTLTPNIPIPATIQDRVPEKRWKLGGFFLAAGVMLALITTGLFFWRDKLTTFNKGEIRSLAVLPFKPLMVGASDESLGLGLADALITRLSNTGRIVVRPTSSIIGYAKSDQNLLTAARELEVDALLDGRIQRDGNRIRITVQFLRASNGEAIWGESFDEQFTNILAVQNTISEKVAHALTLKLTEPEQRLLNKRYTENAEAFELYLKGRYFWNQRTPEASNKAIDLLRQAVKLDPNFALAYAGIADCYVALGTPQVMLGGQRDDNFWTEARDAAQKAIELDPMLAEAHASLGAAIAATYGGDHNIAHREFETAIQMNPNYTPARVYYAVDLAGENRLEEALQHAAIARQLDPVSAPINVTYGMLLGRLRRPNEAINQLRKALELDPNNIRAHWGLGLVYEQLGRYDEAITEHQLALKASNGGILALASVGRVHALTGRRVEAEKVLQQMLEKDRNGERHPYYLAALYLALGDKDTAFDVLEKNRGRYSRGLMKIDQFYDSVRNEARYLELVK